MAQTFFFYDLETSGLNPRQDRIMQFAGQRTDMNLEPIGEPYNLLVALNDDTLPSPDALMVTGITPQKTVEEGYSEAQLLRLALIIFDLTMSSFAICCGVIFMTRMNGAGRKVDRVGICWMWCD